MKITFYFSTDYVRFAVCGILKHLYIAGMQHNVNIASVYSLSKTQT